MFSNIGMTGVYIADTARKNEQHDPKEFEKAVQPDHFNRHTSNKLNEEEDILVQYATCYRSVTQPRWD